MNDLYLVLHNFTKIARHNTMTFAVVVFSLIMSTFGILFYSGYIYNNYSERNSFEGDSVVLSLKPAVSAEEVNAILDKLQVDNQIIQSIVVADSAPVPGSAMGNLKVVGEFNTTYDRRLLSGVNFERNEKRPLLILIEYYVGDTVGYNESPIGKEVMIDNRSYTVSGVIPMMPEADYYIVPVDYYVDTYTVNYIKCVYESYLTKAEASRLENELAMTGIINSFQHNHRKSILLSSSFWLEFSQVLLIFCASILNLFTIIFFWIKRYKQTYNIYSICGGSEAKIRKILVCQSCMVILLGTIIGRSVFSLFSDYLVKMDLIIGGKLGFYSTIVLVVLLITLTFSIYTVWKANHNNTIYFTKE